jgi:hypothetical protein
MGPVDFRRHVDRKASNATMSHCTEQTVTLSERAKALLGQFGLTERDLKRARAGSVSSSETPQYLVVHGDLPDGRTVRMLCRFDLPCHIVTFRPTS